MSFQVEDRVVHPAHGVGSVIGLVTRTFSGAATRQYYEVAIHQGTVWVPVEASASAGLRSLTQKADLTHYRAVLASRPAALTPDHRQRRLELLGRLKPGLFQDACEVVRDLTARGWQKALGETDSTTLRQAREGLCREWAAADGVSVGDATREVDALLSEGRRIYHT
jgi:CarD family transcriptional regulator